jgi:hypothetical protein
MRWDWGGLGSLVSSIVDHRRTSCEVCLGRILDDDMLERRRIGACSS